MTIIYNQCCPEIDDIIAIYQSSGIKRPIHDVKRIREMYRYANLVITAWDDGKPVGIARALTDFSYCCYLSDLAVRAEYQYQGIGKQLITEVKQAIGRQSMLLLLASPTAMDYYPKIGMESVSNGFIIKQME